MTNPQNDIDVALQELNHARMHLRRARNVIYDMECDEYRQYGNRRYATLLEQRRKETEKLIISIDSLFVRMEAESQRKGESNDNA